MTQFDFSAAGACNAVMLTEKLSGFNFAARRTFSKVTTLFRGMPTSAACCLPERE